MICDPGYESCDEYRAQIASLTKEVERWKAKSEANADHARLADLAHERIAYSLKKANEREAAAEATIERLRAALENLLDSAFEHDVENSYTVGGGAIQEARTALQSTEPRT